MDSFYGGKQGISFIIKDKFESVGDMEWCFSFGYHRKLEDNQWINDDEHPYTNSVWYGEYCIIDTPNKNNIENGRVYRRTANHTPKVGSNDTNHAEYVGQIVGPAGGIPGLELKSLEQLDTDFNNLQSKVTAGGTVYYKNTTVTTNNGYTQTYPTVSTPAMQLAKQTDNSVMYKSGKEYFNNSTTPAFKYGFYTFQGVEKENGTDTFPISTIGLGFEIPYVDFDINKITAIPWNQNATITSTFPSEDNKFYKQYKIEVPYGVPGMFISNLTKTNAALNSRQYYILEDIEPNHTVPTDIPSAPTDGSEDKHKITSTKIITGQCFYYDKQITNSGEINVQIKPVVRSGTSVSANFYLWDCHEVTTASVVTNTAATNFGQFELGYSSGFSDKWTLNLIKNMDSVWSDSDQKYHIKVSYAGVTTPVDIGPIGPKNLNIYAHELVEDTTVTPAVIKIKDSTYPEIGPNENEGNLGVQSVDGGTSSNFYLWASTYTTTNTAAYSAQGSWVPMGTANNTQVNLSIPGMHLLSTTTPVVFKEENVPSSITNPDLYQGRRPWN